MHHDVLHAKPRSVRIVVNCSENTQPIEDTNGVLRKWKIKVSKAMKIY
jgi:hypothetical protein